MAKSEFTDAVLELAGLLGWRRAHFRAALTQHGWRTPVSADGKGFPDLVLAKPGRGVIFAEIKADKGSLSPEQNLWYECLKAAGAQVFVWKPRDLEDIARLLGAQT